MSVNYETFVLRLANMASALKTDINPSILVPAAIDYAEQRLYRELDLLATRVVDTSANVTDGQRAFTLPTGTGTFLVVESINVCSPSSQSFTTGGSRVQLLPVTKYFLDLTYPSTVSADVPAYYAMQTNAQAILGPVPDANYQAEVIGTQRPSTLSTSNSSTILTQFFPELFTCAAMIGAADHMRAGGAGGIDQMMQQWEMQYQVLVKSAVVEEARKKYTAEGWTTEQPSPIATPPRV